MHTSSRRNRCHSIIEVRIRVEDPVSFDMVTMGESIFGGGCQLHEFTTMVSLIVTICM